MRIELIAGWMAPVGEWLNCIFVTVKCGKPILPLMSTRLLHVLCYWLSDLCLRTTVNDPVSGNTYEIGDTPLGGVYTSPQYCLSSK
jgi:hypothetical protein